MRCMRLIRPPGRIEDGSVTLDGVDLLALERAFASERHLIGRVPLPPGLSLFAVASAM